MLGKRKCKNQLFSIPILYFLFGMYLVGSVLGVSMVRECDLGFVSLARQLHFGHEVLKWLFYYTVIVLLSRTPLGMIMIPMSVGIRGFIFSATVVSLLWSSESGFTNVLSGDVLPSVIHLPTVFYLSSLCVGLSLKHVRATKLKREEIQEMKRGLKAAVFAMAVGALLGSIV